ncbi:leucine-rich repeat domain-containing protein [Paenibacillus sp. YIM B09110]|uniref:leucine-rich repeat domain-containing protein n=1 Tax=Paenibacillus sp. YIM B09110 TaxID=3126102 RepID=UPI00301DF774
MQAPTASAAAINPNTAYADKLNQLGLFAGTNKGYELDRAPTRLEGIVILIRLLGKEKEAQSLSGNAVPFGDVPKWGAGYVNYAFNNKITQGIDSKRFGSSDAISALQYTTLVLRVLGYQDSKGDFTYQEALNKAASIGLIEASLRDNLKTAKFLRGHAVLISYNALKQKLKGQTTTLAQKLVKDGVITQETATNAGLFDTGSSTAGDKTAVAFPDKGLEQVVRAAINKPTGTIYRSDVSSLTTLESYGVTHNRIRSLTGIGALEKLSTLKLNDNLITDLKPLTALRELKTLNLSLNSIQDISPLSSMHSLEELYVGENFITSINNIAPLTGLKSLSVSNNVINSLDALEPLQELSYLDISGNAVSNISVINKMPSLKTVSLDGNPVADVSPMKGRVHQGYDTLDTIQKLGIKAREIIQATIKSGMSDLEKEEAIHDFVTGHVTYDDKYFSYNIPTVSRPNDSYGALIEQYAICDGYARSMKLLGGMAGLEIFYVNGWSGIGHAWNLIRLDGQLYHVDATWDDPEDLWGGALPDTPMAEQIYMNHQRSHFNMSQTERLKEVHWDFERYPTAKVDPPAASDYQVKLTMNAESPLKSDMIVGVKLYLSYMDGEVDTGFSIEQLVTFPYNQEKVDLTIDIPSYVPVNSGTVTYTLDYYLYHVDDGFGVEETNFLHKDIGLVFTSNKQGILQPDAHLYFTLLKKGSKGVTFNQAAAQGKEDQYVLDGSMFAIKLLTLPYNPPWYEHQVVNTKAVTLPPYSAIYVSELYIGKQFEATSNKYQYGDSLLIANHTSQAKVYKPGELLYTIKTGDKTMNRIADAYVRLSMFEGDFNDQDYMMEHITHRVIFQDQWVNVPE